MTADGRPGALPGDTALRYSVRAAATKADAAAARHLHDTTTRHEQDPMTQIAEPVTRDGQTIALQLQNRTRTMHLMPEALARAHMQERLQEAEHERLAVRVLNARRLRRRAERASLRARRALATALLQ